MKNLIHLFSFASIAASLALQACAATPHQGRPTVAQSVPDFGRTQVIQQAAAYRDEGTYRGEDLLERMARIRARSEASVDRSRPLQAIFNDAEALATRLYRLAAGCYTDLETRRPGLPGCEAYFEIVAEFQGINDALEPLMEREVARNPKGTLRTNGEFARAAAAMQVVVEAMNRYVKAG